jgi:KDO2-lipid IV(A) lauroyltransferase
MRRHDGRAGGARRCWRWCGCCTSCRCRAGGLGAAWARCCTALAGSRRRIALRNLELCLPELDAAERQALVREHFGWLGRSLLERGLLWYASAERLKR